MEDQIIKSGLKSTFFVIIAQIVSFVLGIAKVLILPIILGVTNFGYWQVYLLYMSYVGVFALGFNDGIYLRYGKYNYEDLPKQIFRTSIKSFVVFQFIIMTLVSLLIFFEPDGNKQISMLWASINIPIAGLTGVLIYVFQVTNQLKKYSFYTILDKLIVLIIILVIFVLKTDQFVLIIAADTLSKIMVLALMIYSCKDIIFGKGTDLESGLKELFKNISVGMKLMLANFAGMLILGFGRFIVERFEEIEVYSIYSFAMSTINLILVFVTAIGLVIYPTLNRLDEKKYSIYFIEINKLINIFIFGTLLIYFPLRIFISVAMIEYIQIFEYLPIVFSIVFIQTKMQILINPYYKLLREEKEMMFANIIGFLIAALLILPSYFLSKSILMVVIGTLLAMSIRLYLSELYLKKKLLLKTRANILIEVLGLVIFIFLAYLSNPIIGFIGCLVIFGIYMIFSISTISNYFKYFFRR